MNKKILITGATGFVGSYLVDFLLKNTKDKILGTYYSDNSLGMLGANVGKIETFKIDLRNWDEVSKLISKTEPDIVYHLAAFASAAKSFSSPTEAVINNISSELNILEAIRQTKLLGTKILIVSSAEVYGHVDEKYLPINEDTPLNPTNPYAVSKVAQDFFGKQYFTTYALQTIIVRPFNHIGPRQSDNFVVSSFAKKIAEIEKDKRNPVIPVGNLKAKRDFTDVRDVVRAYHLLMEKGKIGDVYNIGSGRSYKISDILDKLLSFSDKKIFVETDKTLLRPVDDPELTCDSSKIKKAINWKPEIPLEETLRDTLDYWRNII